MIAKEKWYRWTDYSVKNIRIFWRFVIVIASALSAFGFWVPVALIVELIVILAYFLLYISYRGFRKIRYILPARKGRRGKLSAWILSQ